MPVSVDIEVDTLCLDTRRFAAYRAAYQAAYLGPGFNPAPRPTLKSGFIQVYDLGFASSAAHPSAHWFEPVPCRHRSLVRLNTRRATCTAHQLREPSAYMAFRPLSSLRTSSRQDPQLGGETSGAGRKNLGAANPRRWHHIADSARPDANAAPLCSFRANV